MTALISHTSFDSLDAHAMSVFWGHVLGFVEDPEDLNEPGHEECMIRDAETGHLILFIEVPDEKSVKNRVHFDLRPRSGTQDEEVERLLGIGATQVSDQRGKYGPGTGWVVLADPEGNELCILKAEAERAEPS